VIANDMLFFQLSIPLLAAFASLVDAQLKSTTCYDINGITTATLDFQPCIMVVGVDSSKL